MVAPRRAALLPRLRIVESEHLVKARPDALPPEPELLTNSFGRDGRHAGNRYRFRRRTNGLQTPR